MIIGTTLAAGFLIGLVAGYTFVYITLYKSLYKTFTTLLETLVGMKKQGFVPQFDIEQTKQLDLTDTHEF